MNAHSITIPRTAHYYTLGQATSNTKYWWIACHGYGQLAKRFIKKFEGMVDDQTFILAPEGLSRFYWPGLGGEPASSWMTREDRLDEIADYSNYLQTLYDKYAAVLPNDVTIILMGFSQGVATHFRWMMRAFPKYHHVIIWGGMIPEDLDYLPVQHYFQDKSLHFIYGTEDQFLTEARLKAHQELIEKNQLELRVQTFQGKHLVDRKVLEALYAQLRSDTTI